MSGRAEEGAEDGAEPMDQEAVVAHEVAASTTSLMESLVDQGADLSALLNAVTANPIFEAGDGPGSELSKLCQMKGGCVESCGRGCILQLCFRLRTLLCGSTKSVVASRMYGGLAVSMGMEGPLFWLKGNYLTCPFFSLAFTLPAGLLASLGPIPGLWCAGRAPGNDPGIRVNQGKAKRRKQNDVKAVAFSSSSSSSSSSSGLQLEQGAAAEGGGSRGRGGRVDHSRLSIKLRHLDWRDFAVAAVRRLRVEYNMCVLSLEAVLGLSKHDLYAGQNILELAGAHVRVSFGTREERGLPAIAEIFASDDERFCCLGNCFDTSGRRGSRCKTSAMDRPGRGTSSLPSSSISSGASRSCGP